MLIFRDQRVHAAQVPTAPEILRSPTPVRIGRSGGVDGGGWCPEAPPLGIAASPSRRTDRRRQQREAIAMTVTRDFLQDFFHGGGGEGGHQETAEVEEGGQPPQQGSAVAPDPARFRDPAAAAWCFIDFFTTPSSPAHSASSPPSHPTLGSAARAVHWDLRFLAGPQAGAAEVRSSQKQHQQRHPLSPTPRGHNHSWETTPHAHQVNRRLRCQEGGKKAVTPQRRLSGKTSFAAAQSPRSSSLSPQREQQQQQQQQQPHNHSQLPLLARDWHVARACVRCVLFSSCVARTEFRHRIGFSLADARRLFATFNSTQPAHHHADICWPPAIAALVHNCVQAIAHGACKEWARWFSTTSRRQVEETSSRLRRLSGPLHSVATTITAASPSNRTAEDKA